MKSYHLSQHPALLYLAIFLKSCKTPTNPQLPTYPNNSDSTIPCGTDLAHVQDGPKKDQANLL